MFLSCPRCQATLPDWFLRAHRSDTACPNCYAKLNFEIFPAAFERQTLIASSAALADEAAACYEHQSKPAKAICGQCGRFICALCELEIRGQTWCPACLEAPRSATIQGALETSRTNYDSIALALATWPMVLFLYPSILTAPVAIYVALRYWRKPLSIVGRNRWRFVLAISIAVLQVSVFAVLIVSAILVAQWRQAG